MQIKSLFSYLVWNWKCLSGKRNTPSYEGGRLMKNERGRIEVFDASESIVGADMVNGNSRSFIT